VSYLFYPRLTQNCANVNHCPHLGGAALGSVVLSANANDEWLQSLLRQIDALRAEDTVKYHRIEELTAEVEQLKRELKAERQRQFQRSRDEDAVEEGADSTLEGAKKRGAPVGHPGWFRPTPTSMDRIVPVPAPASCPHCRAVVKARPDLIPYDHLQEDWLDGRGVTVCFRHEEGRCTKCRRWVYQAGEGELLRAKIGPHMRARALFLRFDIGLPFRKVVGAVAGLDSIRCTPAAIVGFEKRVAENARLLAGDVAKKLRACEVVHADETYWTINGQRAFAWFHGNEHLAHFSICGTRSGKISRRILGKDYDGALVTDCYAGYDRHTTTIKQKCVEHLKRTAKNWLKATPAKAVTAIRFFHDIAAWAKCCCRWHRRWKKGEAAVNDHEAAWLCREQLRLENTAVDSDKALTLQRRIRRYSSEWLTFLKRPSVPPTNNLAEQAVRFLVVLRKLSFGNRTRAGARRMGAMMTVIQTAKRQGRNVIHFLEALFTLTPNQATRAMYARR
jgi:transposase